MMPVSSTMCRDFTLFCLKYNKNYPIISEVKVVNYLTLIPQCPNCLHKYFSH